MPTKTTTREEETGLRNLDFSTWIRANLAGKENKFTVFDIDFVFRDYGRKKMQFVEVKIYQNESCSGLSLGQSIYLKEISNICGTGIACGAPALGWEWCGFHELQLENTSPSEGRIWWDGELVSEIDLIQLLEMRC